MAGDLAVAHAEDLHRSKSPVLKFHRRGDDHPRAGKTGKPVELPGLDSRVALEGDVDRPGVEDEVRARGRRIVEEGVSVLPEMAVICE